MPFTSLSNSTRFANLPILLVGPILRSQLSNSIVVFIVTKVKVEVELALFDNGTAINFPIGQFDHEGTSKKVGDNLHITYIRLNKYADVNGLSPEDNGFNKLFLAGKVYEYDINFTEINGVAQSPIKTLSSTEISGPNGFSDYLYPGFTRPHFYNDANIQNSRILQGSCRKPHGNWSDAFLAADKIIAASLTNISERPDYLVLSGDQIYADDVADQLLFLIRDAEKKLVNGNEEIDVSDISIDSIKENLDASFILDETTSYQDFDSVYNSLGLISNNKIDLDKLIPGIRGPFIDGGHLTVDSKFSRTHANLGKSHLISLGEYMLMYVFTWSDVLWPNETDFPSFSEVYNSKVSATRQYDVGKFNKKIRHFKTKTENALRNIIGKDPNVSATSVYKDLFDEDELKLKRFRDGMKGSRRAMAHVPTYMMFDDHEITDDCFLNLNWCYNTFLSSGTPVKDEFNKVLTPTNLAKRVLSNGLAALNIFQTMGNNYLVEYYAELGDTIHYEDVLSYLDIHVSAGTLNRTTLQNFLLPTLETTFLDPSFEGARLNSKVNYSSSFIWTADKSKIILLDTRCSRSFPLKSTGTDYTGAPGLASTREMIKAISENTGDIAIVVTPSPVIGHNVLEPAVESFIQISKGLNKFDSARQKFDFEAWHYNKPAKEYLLKRLTLFNHVVFLSGDVHYGFSIEGKYWNESDPLDKKDYSFAQLTSSSMKNKDVLTKTSERIPLLPMNHLNWDTKGEHISNADISELINSWTTNDKKLVPPMNKMKVKHFDGIDNIAADYLNDFWGSLWDSIKDFKLLDPNLLQKYSEYMDFMYRWGSTAQWMLKHRDELESLKAGLIKYFDYIVADIVFIRAAWQANNKIIVLNYKSYWNQAAYDWLFAHFDFIDDNWDIIQNSFNEIKAFWAEPIETKLTVPFNLFYKVINRPTSFYRTKGIKDKSSNRIENVIWQQLDTQFDFGENNGTPSEEVKAQKLAVSMIVKWGGFVGKEVIGTNNFSEITFDWTTNDEKVIQKFWAEVGQVSYDSNRLIVFKPLPEVGDPDYQNTLKPWTTHEVSLKKPTSSDISEVIPN